MSVFPSDVSLCTTVIFVLECFCWVSNICMHHVLYLDILW